MFMEFNIIILPIPIEILYKYIFDYFNKNIIMIFIIFNPKEFTILKYNNPEIAYPEVIVEEKLHGRFICELNNPSYSVDVWVKEKGSYDLTTAYDSGLISDNEVDQIIRYRR